MAQEEKVLDPGLGEVYEQRTSRIINEDGSFNIRKEGLGTKLKFVYQFFIDISWTSFSLIIVAGYILMNVIFAFAYLSIGIEGISGIESLQYENEFLIALFFSFQSFTTVGYGLLSPTTPWINWIASFEAMMGFMSFSIATGLLYGRFSRPSARIMYSKNILVAPFNEGYALMFRIVNMRPNVLMDMEAKVMLTTTQKVKGVYRRRYRNIKLSIDRIDFFPLNWTIVHPIDEDSPFWGKNAQEIIKLNPEVLILIKGFDETFSQVVHSRYSYTLRDIVFNAKFLPAFHTDKNGATTIDVRDIHKFQKMEGSISGST